ncbi:MAG: 3-carboxy-cis,cis-muconate cycloisomerase, partial [Cryptosporangiaceae bacterium]|nr:3-carboxy-cis,cis-muconate cycloisomerase [Cryptosporangiaceae bacterium]
MRPSSSPSEPASGALFGALSGGRRADEQLSDAAWLAGLLDAERALALACGRAGVIPEDAATAIAVRCDPTLFDAAELGQAATTAGNPVVPLVRRLTALVPDFAAPHVHRGATSQDILDTAASLVARRALEPIREDLTAAA